MRLWYGSSQVNRYLYYPKQIKPENKYEELENAKEFGDEKKELNDFFTGREIPNDFAVLCAKKGYGKTYLAKKHLETEPTPFWDQVWGSFCRILPFTEESHQPEPKFYFACKARSEINFWRSIASNFGLDYGLYFLSFFPRVVDSTYHCKIISTCI